MDKVVVRTAWTLVVIGALIEGGAVFLAIQTAVSVHASATTEGTVVKFVEIPSERNSKTGRTSGSTYAPVVRYTVGPGEERTHRGMGTAVPAYTVGERVTIYYDPANPDDARMGTFLGLAFPPLFLAGFGAIFGGVGAVMLAVDRRVRREDLERQRLAAARRYEFATAAGAPAPSPGTTAGAAPRR